MGEITTPADAGMFMARARRVKETYAEEAKKARLQALREVLELIEKLSHNTRLSVPDGMFDWTEIPGCPWATPIIYADICFTDNLKTKLDEMIKEA